LPPPLSFDAGCDGAGEIVWLPKAIEESRDFKFLVNEIASPAVHAFGRTRFVKLCSSKLTQPETQVLASNVCSHGGIIRVQP
jgi:hypothetical protein